MTGWWRFAQVEQVDPPDADGWHIVHVRFEVLEEAAGNVLSFGPFAQVISPDELNQCVQMWAERVVEWYRAPKQENRT